MSFRTKKVKFFLQFIGFTFGLSRFQHLVGMHHAAVGEAAVIFIVLANPVADLLTVDYNGEMLVVATQDELAEEGNLVRSLPLDSILYEVAVLRFFNRSESSRLESRTS